MSDDREQEHGPRADEIDDGETIRVSRAELRRLLNDNERLSRQVTETQAANTALVEEHRALKSDLAEEERLRAFWCNETKKAQDQIKLITNIAKIQANSTDRSAMVREFFDRVAPHQERLPSPGVPSPETVRFRVRLVAEEFVELLEAVFCDRAAVDQIRACLKWFDDESKFAPFLWADGLPGVVDALIDIAYVTEGFLVACGVDGSAVFRLVHDANMRKEGGPVIDGKQTKPDGWTLPDVAGELRRQGLAVGRKGPENASESPEGAESPSDPSRARQTASSCLLRSARLSLTSAVVIDDNSSLAAAYSAAEDLMDKNTRLERLAIAVASGACAAETPEEFFGSDDEGDREFASFVLGRAVALESALDQEEARRAREEKDREDPTAAGDEEIDRAVFGAGTEKKPTAGEWVVGGLGYARFYDPECRDDAATMYRKGDGAFRYVAWIPGQSVALDEGECATEQEAKDAADAALVAAGYLPAPEKKQESVGVWLVGDDEK